MKYQYADYNRRDKADLTVRETFIIQTLSITAEKQSLNVFREKK